MKNPAAATSVAELGRDAPPRRRRRPGASARGARVKNPSVPKRSPASASRLRAILANQPDCIKLLDADGILVDMNRAGLAMIEVEDLAAVAGRCVFPIVVAEHREAFAATVKRVCAGERATMEFEIVGMKGTRRWLEMNAAPFREPGSRRMLALSLTRDVTARKQSEALTLAHRRVLEMIAAAAPLSDTLDELMRVLEAQAPGMLCSVLLLDPDGVHLRHGAAPSLPKEYSQAIDGAAIGPSAGSCGTAAFRAAPVVVEDIAADPLWADFRDLALPHGLRACWSTPIFDPARKVLGTFAMYYREPAGPTARHRWLIEFATQTAAIAIERHAVETRLRRAIGAMENTFEHMDQGISILDADLRVVGVNRRFRELLGIPEDVCAPGASLESNFRYNAARGEYGPGDAEEQVRTRMALARKFEAHRFERDRPDGTVLEIRGLPLPGGGFVTLYTDVTQRVRGERALRASEERFRSLTALSSDWYWEQDEQFRFTMLSGAGAAAMSRTGDPSIYLGKARWDFPDTEPMAGDWSPHRTQLERREAFRDLFLRRRMQDGSTRYMSVSGEPVLKRDGSLLGYRGVAKDVTRSVEAEQRLRASEARFRALTELSSDLYWETDAEHRISRFVYGAQAKQIVSVERILGHARWEIPSLAPDEEGWRAHRATLDARLPFKDFELARLGADGEARYYVLSGEPVFDEGGGFAGYRGVGRDVTESKKAETQLEQLAHFDALTGLPNRALLHDRLRQAMARADRGETLLAVMFLDLDRFKEINDSLGHAAGDEVLKEAARRLLSCVRATDTVARLGGDEFTVLLEDIHQVDEISSVAAKILAAFGENAEVGGQDVHLSTSIGITVYPLDDRSAEALVKNADQAMYQAKQEGRDNFQFYAVEIGERAERRADLEQRLHRALQRGEFELHYQPQVDIASGRIFGVEALLRWNDTELGPVSPAQFIPVAEETGLIGPIGDWVLVEACRQCKAWLDAGLGPLRVAVNLSARQFRKKKLARRIGEILRASGLPASSLEVEVTEGAAMQRAERAIRTLDELRQIGVQVSIDDFGTGYSSLAYLQRFPVNVLKIDQSFVRDIGGGDKEIAIVNTVIQLAKLLGLRALAEGVETAEQLAYLRAHGCDAYQGYLFSRPLPANAIESLLAARKRDQASLQAVR